MRTFKEQIHEIYQLEEEIIQELTEELAEIELMEGDTAASRLKRSARKLVAMGKAGRKSLKAGGKFIARSHILRGNKFVKRNKLVTKSQQKLRGIKSGRVMKRMKKKLHTAKLKNMSKNKGLKRLLGIQRLKTQRKLGK